MTVLGGYRNKILRIDLTKRKIKENSINQDALRQFIGGDGLASKIIYDEVLPGVDPLDPENRLVFMTGPLTGVVPGGSTYVVACKSPATGYTMCSSRAQGYFAPELKFAGYDAIVFQGKAEKPVYLWIREGDVEIRNAAKLWGRNTYETDDMIKEELNEPKAKIACIGPAGENQVYQACIINEKSHAAARGGVGAVMGSKNLKAIVARGTKRVPVANEEKFRELRKKWAKVTSAEADPTNHQRSKYGTAAFLRIVYEIGDLPIMNFSRAVLPGVEKLDGKSIRDASMFKKDLTCFGCTYHHDKLIEIKEGPYAGLTFVQPEYEDMAAWGSNIGVTDPGVAAYGTDLCNQMGLDCLATGNAVAFSMECYEKRLIDKKDTGGLELKFGNHESAFELIRKIAARDGFGSILAKDVKRAAEHIGKGAEKLAVHVKGMSSIMHDLRASWGYALQYAVGSAGPVHEGGGNILFRETAGKIPRFSMTGLATSVAKGQEERMFVNCLGSCEWSSPSQTTSLGLELICETLSAVTGWNITPDEGRKVAIRLLNLRRVFNMRNGLKPEDDTLSHRLLEPPIEGPVKGKVVPIKALVSEYYEAMGWDEKTGKPLRRTLEELGLGDLVKDIW